MVIVVLGMHGSGTSLVANILRQLGVDMGQEWMGKVKNYEVWEDKDFVMMNAAILAAAGGSWDSPPSPGAIDMFTNHLESRLETLVATKQCNAGDGLWGWKDPRNCLTIQLYHPYLTGPRYVWVYRPNTAVVASLMDRGFSNRNARYWIDLVQLYQRRASTFMTNNVDAKDHIALSFNDLILCKEVASYEIARLAQFIGIDDTLIQRALETIDFKRGLV